MVDPIKGSGDKIIITKPKVKESQGKTKDGDFNKILDEKSGSEPPGQATAVPRSKAEANLAILNQQNIERMQKFEAIAKAIRTGTYKMADPQELAKKLLEVVFDKKTRQKFAKKVLSEEIELAKSKNRPISELELKKLIFMVKSQADVDFNDAELDALLKELV